MVTSECEGFLLRYRKLPTERLWLELFCCGLGKVAAVCRRNCPPPLWTELNLTLNRRQGELWTVKQWEEIEPPRLFPGREIAAAFYLNELLIYLLPREEPYPELYETYRQALEELHQDLEAALRRFELELLAAIGYDLPLQGPFEPKARYHYEIGEGFRLHPKGELSGATLMALRERRFGDEQAKREAKKFLRRVLAHYLGNRPLKSRELWRGKG